MNTKKTEYISFMTDETTKKKIEEYAKKEKWTISTTTNEIIKSWIREIGNPEKLKD